MMCIYRCKSPYGNRTKSNPTTERTFVASLKSWKVPTHDNHGGCSPIPGSRRPQVSLLTIRSPEPLPTTPSSWWSRGTYEDHNEQSLMVLVFECDASNLKSRKLGVLTRTGRSGVRLAYDRQHECHEASRTGITSSSPIKCSSYRH